MCGGDSFLQLYKTPQRFMSLLLSLDHAFYTEMPSKLDGYFCFYVRVLCHGHNGKGPFRWFSYSLACEQSTV